MARFSEIGPNASPSKLVQVLPADVEGGRAVVGAGAEAVLQHRRGGHSLERGARRELALVGPGQQRGAGRVAGQARVVGLGDAAGEHVGVVGRRAGHRHHAAGPGVQHDRGRRVGGVRLAVGRRGLRAGPLHRVVQLALGDRLDPGVDRGHQVVAVHRRLGGQGRLRVPDDVHRDLRLAFLATQVGVVGLLQAGPADQVGALQHLALGCGGGEFALGDRRQVAEDVRGVQAVGRREAADGLGAGGHAGEEFALLGDLQRLLHRDVARDRDRLQQRAVPTGLGDLRGAGPDLVGDGLRRGAQDRGQPGQRRDAVVLGVQQGCAVHRQGQRRLVVDQRAAQVVQDVAAHRRGDHRAHVVRGGRVAEGLAGAHLQVPQPGDQGREQRDHQHAQHHQPRVPPIGQPA